MLLSLLTNFNTLSLLLSNYIQTLSLTVLYRTYRSNHLLIFDSLVPTWTIDVLIPNRFNSELHLGQYSGVSLLASSLRMIILFSTH